MNRRDLINLPLGNLKRQKLRTSLTTTGVMIAIAALVALLSFGAGNQQLIEEQYNELGLLNTAHVSVPYERETVDTLPGPVLNDSIMTWLSTLPGIRLAYPFSTFDVTVAVLDTSVQAKAQVVPATVITGKLFSRLSAGTIFSSDSAKEAMISQDLAEDLGCDSLEDMIGQSLIVSVERIRLDSGLVSALEGSGEIARRVFQRGWRDSIKQPEYISRLAKNELSQAIGRFASGVFEAPATVSDTLIIVGVLRTTRGRSRTMPVVIPVATAEKFAAGGLSNDPTELYVALKGGTLIAGNSDRPSQTYPRITLQMKPGVSLANLKDSVESRGYRFFSFAEQFEEIGRFFFYFDLAMALIGLIALMTASLGIVNTMVMSIIERRREIGVLKSLGADESDIRKLFLAEAGLIGMIGSIGGIILGWLVTRLGSAVAQYFMAREGLDEVELFALPWWLVITALVFGLGVSIAAGAYPAARAARVDPIEALRDE